MQHNIWTQIWNVAKVFTIYNRASFLKYELSYATFNAFQEYNSEEPPVQSFNPDSRQSNFQRQISTKTS